MKDNYLFVDGSALLADVKRVRSDLVISSSARLSIAAFVKYFTGPSFREFHSCCYRRFVFYFVRDDQRLRSAVELPDFTRPGAVSDIHIEYCGKRILDFERARDWLEKHHAPESVRECLYRSEKAVDTQICCDALQLAATGKLDRLFLYTNDYDFVPLVRTLRQFGTNINLMRLRGGNVNADLVKECDAFNAMEDNAIPGVFVSEAKHTGSSANTATRKSAG